MYDIAIPATSVAPYRLPDLTASRKDGTRTFGARRMQVTLPNLERVRNLESSSRRGLGGRKMKHLLWFTLALLVASIEAQSQEQKPVTAEPASSAKSCLEPEGRRHSPSRRLSHPSKSKRPNQRHRRRSREPDFRSRLFCGAGLDGSIGQKGLLTKAIGDFGDAALVDANRWKIIALAD